MLWAFNPAIIGAGIGTGIALLGGLVWKGRVFPIAAVLIFAVVSYVGFLIGASAILADYEIRALAAVEPIGFWSLWLTIMFGNLIVGGLAYTIRVFLAS